MQHIDNLKDFKLRPSDFIAFNKGKFLDSYQIDKLLGEGAFG